MDDIYAAKKEEIAKDIKENRVILFMKGTREMPMCGFSAKVISALNNIEAEYVTRNVLEDEVLREAIKEFSDWPTVPQLYIDGEFIGGCDITVELYRNGELAKMAGGAERIEDEDKK
ncbi:MAG: Grx4 family monothiol glutaredoxin [Candidatus Gracilibacteria bacterium]